MVESMMTSRAESPSSPPPRAPVPGRAGGAPSWVAPASRALRVGVDLASLAALVGARPGNGGTLRVFVFWMLSLVVFPYARMADYVGQRRESHLLFLATGVVLALVGGAGQLGLLGEWFRYRVSPASESIWLGIALGFAGAAQLRRASPGREGRDGRAPDAGAPTPLRHLACGLASTAAGAMWLWLLRG